MKTVVVYIVLFIIAFLISIVSFVFLNENDFKNPDSKILFVFSNLGLSLVFYELFLKKSVNTKRQRLLFYLIPFFLLGYLISIVVIYFYKIRTHFNDFIWINLLVILFSVFFLYYIVVILKKINTSQ